MVGVYHCKPKMLAYFKIKNVSVKQAARKVGWEWMQPNWVYISS